MISANITLDVRKLNCPLPILKTRKAIKGMEDGHVLEVRATDPGSVKDMESFCSQTGNELLSSEEKNNEYIYFIRKAN